MLARRAGYALAILLGLQAGTAVAQPADSYSTGVNPLSYFATGSEHRNAPMEIDPSERAGLNAMDRADPPISIDPGDVSDDDAGMATSTDSARPRLASLSPDSNGAVESQAQLPQRFREQVVNYSTKWAPGTIVVDTAHTYLYYVLGNGQAIRYGIGVGRDGFRWSGHERITRMAEWPDWIPPAEMLERQPYLPRWMAGGPGNPLGARALYLGHTLYRIHGTNDPTSIGKYASSGCIHLTNAAVEDLYRRVHVGTPVVVLPGSPHQTASARR